MRRRDSADRVCVLRADGAPPATAAASDLERLLDLRWKDGLDFQSMPAHALLERIVEKRLERRSIALDAIRPRIVAKNLLREKQLIRDPRQWEERRRDVRGASKAAPAGLVERLEQAHRQPPIALVHFATHRDHVHDRKNAGLSSIRQLDRAVVGEKTPDARITARERCRRPRGKNRV